MVVLFIPKTSPVAYPGGLGHERQAFQLGQARVRVLLLFASPVPAVGSTMTLAMRMCRLAVERELGLQRDFISTRWRARASKSFERPF